MIKPLVYQMAIGGGGTSAEIVERAQLMQDIFDAHGIELVNIEDEVSYNKGVTKNGN